MIKTRGHNGQGRGKDRVILGWAIDYPRLEIKCMYRPVRAYKRIVKYEKAKSPPDYGVAKAASKMYVARKTPVKIRIVSI